MDRMKKFFIYFILVIAFFLVSQVLIYLSLNTTYSYKNVEIKSDVEMQAEVQATSVNGFAKVKIYNNKDSEIENKYLKLEFYSRNNISMGIKYVKIDIIKAKEEKEFEVKFNYNKVNRTEISIVDEKE